MILYNLGSYLSKLCLGHVVMFGSCGYVWVMWLCLGHVVMFGPCGYVWVM